MSAADFQPAWSGPRLIATSGVLALAVLALAPMLLMEVPALVDYPNHLARMGVLLRSEGPAANPFYEVRGAFYPNMAMDLIVPPAGKIIGIETATRILYVVSQMLIVSGSAVIGLAASRRMLLSATCAVLFLYSIPFAWGFVNFHFGLGLALWGIAAWITFRERPQWLRLLVHTVFVAALFTSHMFALGLYGATLGILELWRASSLRTGGRSLAHAMALLAFPAAVALLAWKALGGAVGGSGTSWELAHKLRWLFAVNGFSLAVSMFITTALFLLTYVLCRRGAVRLEGAGTWLAVGFASLYVVTPFKLFDTAFVDVRVAVAAALILPAFVSIRIDKPRLRSAAAVFLAALVVVNLGHVAFMQRAYSEIYGGMRASFGLLEQNSRVLTAFNGDPGDPPANLFDYPIYHAPSLAVYYANAFVPTFFAYPGKQPVEARPEVRHLVKDVGGPEPLQRLVSAINDPTETHVAANAANWTEEFDYLYVLGPTGANPLPQILEQVAAGRRFKLYRISRSKEVANREHGKP